MKKSTTGGQAVEVLTEGAALVDIDQLVPFQGMFKTLTPENYKRLRTQLLETGIAAAATVWKKVGGGQTLFARWAPTPGSAA